MNPPSTICQLPPAPRILVRGTNWLGDAVMTTPALLRLREKFPDAHIALLTPDKLRELWLHPAVDETIPFAPGCNKKASPVASVPERKAILCQSANGCEAPRHQI